MVQPRGSAEDSFMNLLRNVAFHIHVIRTPNIHKFSVWKPEATFIARAMGFDKPSGDRFRFLF